MRETPLLINVGSGTFADYIKSLTTKSGKRTFNYVQKHNRDLTYTKISFRPTLINEFMDLWEQQEIGPKKKKTTWSISRGFVEFLNKKGHLLCFAAHHTNDSNKMLSVHFVERHGDYVECYPPMYDKEKYSGRYIAKFMWFHLIEYAINDPEIRWLDLGGGNTGTWRDKVVNREKHSSSYKWLYVPQSVKENPQNEKPYKAKIGLLRYSKRLEEDTRPENKTKNWLITKYAIWVWYNRGSRLERLSKRLVDILTRGQAE